MFKQKQQVLKCTFIFFLIVTILYFAIYIPAMEKSLSPIQGVPISLSPPGSADAPFHVDKEDGFELGLVFEKEGISKEELDKIDKLITEKFDGAGVYVPVIWEIYSLQGECVLQGKTIADSINVGTSSEGIRRVFEHHVRLKPGDYRLVVNIDKNIPELIGIQTRVQLSHSVSFIKNNHIVRMVFGIGIVCIDIILGIWCWFSRRKGTL